MVGVVVCPFVRKHIQETRAQNPMRLFSIERNHVFGCSCFPNHPHLERAIEEQFIALTLE